MLETTIIIYALIILVLLAVSAFFSAAETGLTTASSAKIHKLKTNGDKRARLVLQLREDKDQLMGAILLGNNAINILASALATSLAISWFGTEGVIYATITMTILILLFGEVLPKTYAVYNAEKVSIWLAPLIYFLIKIMAPVTLLVKIIADSIMKISGLVKEGEDLVSPSEELRGAIDMHHASGGFEKENRDMLASILDLERIEIKDIMIHRKYITSVDLGQPVTQIVSQVMDTQHTRIPLWRDKPENVVGVLHVRALLTALRNHVGDLEELNIEKIAAKPWFVPQTNMIGNQLIQFREKRSHLALVVNEYGDLVGLVTLEDILEEIVGEIDDEHEITPTELHKTGKKGIYEVDGEMTVRDLNRELGWSLPDRHAATIAGLLLHKLKYIPEEGEEGRIYGISYKVLKKDNNRIARMRIKKFQKTKKAS